MRRFLAFLLAIAPFTASAQEYFYQIQNDVATYIGGVGTTAVIVVPPGMDYAEMRVEYWNVDLEPGNPNLPTPFPNVLLKVRYGVSPLDPRPGNPPSYWLSPIPHPQAGKWYIRVDPVNLVQWVNSYVLRVTLVPSRVKIVAQPKSTEVLVGEPATFIVAATGTPPLRYQWLRNGKLIPGANSASLVTAPARLSDDNLSFSCEVANDALSKKETTSGAKLRVVQPVSISKHPQSQNKNAGESVTFSVEAGGVPVPTYQWFKNDAEIPGANANSFSIGHVGTKDEGAYKVRVRNTTKGTVNTLFSAAAALSVDPALAAPKIVTAPVSTARLVGESVTFAVGASGNPPPAYQWRKGGEIIGGATSSTLTLSGLHFDDAGVYSVRVSNSVGEANASATLDVRSERLEPYFSSLPGGISAFIGDPFTIRMPVFGKPAPTLQWRKDGEPIPGATDPIYSIASARLTDAGTYDLVAINAHGSATSLAVNVSVTEPEEVMGIQWARDVPLPSAGYYSFNLKSVRENSDGSITIAGKAVGTAVGTGKAQEVFWRTMLDPSGRVFRDFAFHTNFTLFRQTTDGGHLLASSNAVRKLGPLGEIQWEREIGLAPGLLVDQTESAYRRWNQGNPVTSVAIEESPNGDYYLIRSINLEEGRQYSPFECGGEPGGNTADLNEYPDWDTKILYADVIHLDGNGNILRTFLEPLFSSRRWICDPLQKPSDSASISLTAVANDGTLHIAFTVVRIGGLNAEHSWWLYEQPYLHSITPLEESRLSVSGGGDYPNGRLTLPVHDLNHRRTALIALMTPLKRGGIATSLYNYHDYFPDGSSAEIWGETRIFGSLAFLSRPDLVVSSLLSTSDGGAFITANEISATPGISSVTRSMKLTATGKISFIVSDLSMWSWPKPFRFDSEPNPVLVLEKEDGTLVLLGRESIREDGEWKSRFKVRGIDLAGQKLWEVDVSKQVAGLELVQLATVTDDGVLLFGQETDGERRCRLIKVGPLRAPRIVSFPEDLRRNVGESARFAVEATGSPDPTYQWLKDGLKIQDATNSVFEVENVRQMDGGTYSVSVSVGGVSQQLDAELAVQSADSSSFETIAVADTQIFSKGQELGEGWQVAESQTGVSIVDRAFLAGGPDRFGPSDGDQFLLLSNGNETSQVSKRVALTAAVVYRLSFSLGDGGAPAPALGTQPGAEVVVTLRRAGQVEPAIIEKTFQLAPASPFTEFALPLTVATSGDYDLSFQSISGKPAALDGITLTSGPGITSDVSPPEALQANGGSTSVIVAFSEPISAVNTSNFEIPNLTVQGVELIDDASVKLTTSPQIAGVDYTVIINAVGDRNGNFLPYGSTAVFRSAETAFEYYIDTDPGPGNGIGIAVQTEPVVIEIPPASIAALSNGIHRLVCRSRDWEGNWSIAFARPFYKSDAEVAGQPLISAFEYQWFRDGQFIGQTVKASVSSPESEVFSQIFDPLAGLDWGSTYNLVVTPLDSNGQRGDSVSTRVAIQGQNVSIGNIAFRSNREITFTISGAKGRKNIVQTSVDLEEWIELDSILADADVVEITVQVDLTPLRFFRVITR